MFETMMRRNDIYLKDCLFYKYIIQCFKLLQITCFYEKGNRKKIGTDNLFLQKKKKKTGTRSFSSKIHH